MAALSKPREAALCALVNMQKDGAYLNFALRDILSKSDMDERDKALATTIAMGVCKNRLFIDNIIENLSTLKLKKLSVWILNILRIGVFSLKFLDKIPASATVNECVRLSRRYGHSASAGFVNAILRKASSCGDFLPGDTSSPLYISIKYSLPLWLCEKWQREGYGEDFFRAMNEEPPVTVRLNTLKADSLGEGFEKSSLSPYTYTYVGKGSVEHTDAFKDGMIAIQDGASQLCVMALDIGENMRVLDLCAAPGGKSGFIAQLMKNTGELTACDLHPHKIEVIENNLSRLGVHNATVLLSDATVFRKDFENSFDRVLADVPCSGLGVLRRRPDIKWAKTEDSEKDLSLIGRSILQNAARYVKKGGKLAFSTCTVSREENEENTKYFLANFPEFTLLEEQQLLPHIHGTDGFFYAVFERK